MRVSVCVYVCLFGYLFSVSAPQPPRPSSGLGPDIVWCALISEHTLTLTDTNGDIQTLTHTITHARTNTDTDTHTQTHKHKYTHTYTQIHTPAIAAPWQGPP